MFFPALLVITTLVAQVEEGPTLVGETRAVLEQFLPADTLDLVQSSVLSHHIASSQLIFSAAVLSLFAGLGVMLSLMEGFRRAYQLPPEDWTLLGPARPRPAAGAHRAGSAGAGLAGHRLRPPDRAVDHRQRGPRSAPRRHLLLAQGALVGHACSPSSPCSPRSTISAPGARSTGCWVVPGAIAGTLIWFPATLAYGWYVTSVADYYAHLRLLRRRHRHPGLALHHFVQRAARRRAERRPLLGSHESDSAAMPSREPAHLSR